MGQPHLRGPRRPRDRQSPDSPRNQFVRRGRIPRARRQHRPPNFISRVQVNEQLVGGLVGRVDRTGTDPVEQEPIDALFASQGVGAARIPGGGGIDEDDAVAGRAAAGAVGDWPVPYSAAARRGAPLAGGTGSTPGGLECSWCCRSAEQPARECDRDLPELGMSRFHQPFLVRAGRERGGDERGQQLTKSADQAVVVVANPARNEEGINESPDNDRGLHGTPDEGDNQKNQFGGL